MKVKLSDGCGLATMEHMQDHHDSMHMKVNVSYWRIYFVPICHPTLGYVNILRSGISLMCILVIFLYSWIARRNQMYGENAKCTELMKWHFQKIQRGPAFSPT